MCGISAFECSNVTENCVLTRQAGALGRCEEFH